MHLSPPVALAAVSSKAVVLLLLIFCLLLQPLGVGHCSMFCCKLLYVHSSVAIILIGKRELVVFLNFQCYYYFIIIFFQYRNKKSHLILNYVCFSVDVPQFCKANPNAIVRDEDNCAQYYNCSDKQSNIGDFLAECRYPDLFSDVYMNCRSFNTVSCDKRLEPQSPCKFVSLKKKLTFECIK